MLIDFTVGNFLSFNEPVTFSMEQAKITEHQDSNCFDAGKLKLLKSAVVYGANSSGKSNLIKAMNFVNSYLLANELPDKDLKTNYRFSTTTYDEPTFIEIRFIVNNEIVRYGFEVDREKVHKEWLYSKPNKISGKERMMFTREFDKFDINQINFKNSSGLKEKTKQNRLYLNIAAEFNQSEAVSIMEWFQNITLLYDIEDESLFELSCGLYSDSEIKKFALEFISQFNLGFDDFDVKRTKIEFDGYPNIVEKITTLVLNDNDLSDELTEVATYHNKYDAAGNIAGIEKLDLENDESLGTRKIFVFSALLIAALLGGRILVVDELDASLHPLLTQKIIELFHSPINDKNAQLIFTTHDTNLLSSEYFRRDQIWFTEKDQYGATDLYSLVEIKETRKDASFAKNYINGKYGAIPFIGDFYGLDQEL